MSVPGFTIGTSAHGSVGNAAGMAIAALLNAKRVVRAAVEATTGQSVLLPRIKPGALDAGIVNVLEVAAARRGEGVFAARPLAGVLALCVLFPNRTGLFVRAGSGMRHITDLKGKNVSYGFAAMTSMNPLVEAILANGGLSLADIHPVDVLNANDAIDAFVQGRVDAFYSAPGAGRIAEAQKTAGEVRMLSLSTGREAIAAMQRVVPESFALETLPQAGWCGIAEPVQALAYDLPLLVGAHVADDMVYGIAKALAENSSGLADALPEFRAFSPATMARALPCDYHPAAIGYYREHGLWRSG